MPNFSKNAGYGRLTADSVVNAHPLGSGKLFVVGDSSVANRDLLQQVFDGDLDTNPRFFATIDAAINACTANASDNIVVMPGHTETVASAGAITADVAGVSIIGLGNGADKPTLTFSDTASTVAISGASVTMKGFRLVPGVDAVVSPLVLTGDDVSIDVEVIDASDAVEFERAVLATSVFDWKRIEVFSQ